MPEAVEIKIPVSIQDQTGSGINSINRKVSQLEKNINSVSKALQHLLGDYDVNLTATDQASPKIASVEDALSKLGGDTADIGISADDEALGTINNVSDAANTLDGMTSDVQLDADDAASSQIEDVSDAASDLDGTEATTYIEADDSATQIFHDAGDTASDLDGTEATVYIDASDAATDTLTSVESKANDLDGKVITIAVQAGNNADEVVNGVIGKARTGTAALMGAAGVTMGVGDSLNTYADFESGMSEVSAISGATGEQLDQLTEKAKYMGATTKFTATESADAFKYMAMAGWKTGDMLNGIDGIMNLAAASGENLGTTSDIVTDALTAFGLKASDSTHFADVLAATSSNANTNVAMMGESFRYVAPLAGAMNYSIEDVSQALGIMANSGIKSSMAGTSLRRMITNLVSPTDAEAEAMEKYGISLTDGEGKQKTLMQVMENMRDSLGGLSEDEQTAAASTIFGKQAMAGALAIVNASEEDFDKLAEAIDGADGASKSMSDTMIDNLAGSATLMQSALEGVKDNFGEGMEPVVRSFVDSITGQLPKLGDFVSNFFDGFNDDVEQMKRTSAWNDADFIGKIDIAWDTLIAEPLTQWANEKGATTISGIIGNLFSSAFKLLPGGEEGGLTSWLSLGAIGIGGEAIAGMAGKVAKLSTSLQNFGTAGTILGDFTTIAGQAVGPIAAAAAAIGAIALAIDTYNEKKIQTSLSEHFGELTLTNEQSQELADHIIDTPWTVNVEPVLGELKNVSQLETDARTALESNAVIEFKANAGVTLGTDDIESYIKNTDEYVKGVTGALEKQTYSADIMVQTVLGDSETGEKLSTAIKSWTMDDTVKMDSLSKQLTDAVDQALSDGVLDVDEQKHIAELQNKINGIMSRWTGFQQEAQWQVLQDNYGNLSGEQLSAGAYEQLSEDLEKRREARSGELDQMSEAFYEQLQNWNTPYNEAGEIDKVNGTSRLQELGLNYDDVRNEWARAIQYEKDAESARIMQFQSDTLSGAYSDEVGGWTQQTMGNAQFGQDALDYLRGTQNTVGAASMFVNDKADKGLSSMYDQYFSGQVSDMRDSLIGYLEDYGKVPDTLRDTYNSALEVAAASGDYTAGSQLLANTIATSGDQALIEAVQNGDYGEDMMQALQLALADGASEEELGISGVKAKVEGLEVDDSNVPQILTDISTSIQSTLDETGSTQDLTVDGLTITVGDTQVAADSVTTALQNAGVDTSGVEITAGATVHVTPQGEVTVTGMPDTVTQTDDGTTPTVDVDGTANATITDANTDTSAAVAESQNDVDAAYETGFDTDSNTTVALTQTNNADEIYGETDSDIKGIYGAGFSTTAPVRITLIYSITNPSASISLGGDATGSGTVTASVTARASGGEIGLNGPEFFLGGEEGLEYVIPTVPGRRSRGIELWKQAGEDLGVYPLSPAAAFADGGAVGGKSSSSSTVWDVYGRPSSGEGSGDLPSMNGGGPTSGGGASGSTVSVSVSMNPTIRIDGSGSDPESIQAVLKAHIREYADDVGDEIALKLKSIFENMPTEDAG